MGGWFSKASGVGDLFVRVTSSQLESVHSSLESLAGLHDSLQELGADELPARNSGMLLREALEYCKISLSSLDVAEGKSVNREPEANGSVKSPLLFSSLGFGDRVYCDRLGEGTVTSVSPGVAKIRFGSRRVVSFTPDGFEAEKFVEAG